ncbi:MAG TPA: hypothetical protein PKY06_20600 [Saprospiraceae bacterium]|nr:hypothetical protein [Flavobacteriaceae bacterium]HPG09365.1 hypothetical protein [Saprospiraceae bacterium]
MTIEEYLHLVEDAYINKGKLFGQRAPLKTKTAQKVRERMIDDLGKYAVLPAVVLGVVTNEKTFLNFENQPKETLEVFGTKVNPKTHVTIIDGMQRTTALYEAIDQHGLSINTEMRVELWIAKSSNSLLYRMLVLNSGQIPWNLKRQVEIIFRSLKSEIELNIPAIKLILSDDRSRRSNPGEYQAADFIELFILFGLRKNQVNMQDQISEEFARLDFVETSSKDTFSDNFIVATKYLVDFDNIISTVNEENIVGGVSRFKKGIHLFTSQPARVGFVVAFSRHIYGITGMMYDPDIIDRRLERLTIGLTKEINFMNKLDDNDLAVLLDFQTLDERLKIPVGKVGDFERDYFTKAFSTLFEVVSGDQILTSWTPLWVS